MNLLRLAAKDGELMGWMAPPEIKTLEAEEPKMQDCAKITFTWSENGFVPEGGLVVHGFKAAHALLAKWARHAPRYDGGEGCAYDKTGFEIEAEGLEKYEGRFDIQTPDYPNHEPYDLIKHIEDFNEYWLPLSVKTAKTDADKRMEQAEYETRKLMVRVYRLMMKLEEEPDLTQYPEVPEPEPVVETEPEPEVDRGYSGHKFEGPKYDNTLDVKEIAKRVRAEIKAAKKDGRLPKDFKASVRISNFSMGCSLSATIVAVPEDWTIVNPAWRAAYDANDRGRYYNLKRYGERLMAALELLQGFVSAYKMDDSDSMTDYFCVNFYDHVSVGYELEKK